MKQFYYQCALPALSFLLFATFVAAQAPINPNLKSIPRPSKGAVRTKGAPVLAAPLAVVSGEQQIFPTTYSQSEIHLSVNKTNPQGLILSSNITRQAVSSQSAFWSTNGGLNWSSSGTAMPANGVGRSDPSTAFDALGNGFVAALTVDPNNPDGDPLGYSVQSTANNGTNWTNQVAGAALAGLDKEMIAADDVATSPFANNLYCAWMNPNLFVQFNRSVDHGNNFSAPVALNGNWGQGANVQTGPHGEVYVCWADYTNNQLPEKGLGFTRSLDGGNTFAPAAVVFPYVGIRNAFDGQAAFGGTRVNSFPSMAVDKSDGVHNGRIYVTYAAMVGGKSVVQLNWSDNQGVNWSAPLTVSIPTGQQSWFPWVAVDNHGVVFVIYYCMDQPTGASTNTYMAISIDAGASVTNQRVSSVAHTTAPIPGFAGGYAGDYIGVTALNWKAWAAWMDNRTGTWQNYVGIEDNSPVINGAAAFCTSSTFTLANVPAWYNPTWTASPAGIVSPNTATGMAVTFTSVNSGTVVLSANIDGTIVSKTIAVGAPVSTKLSIVSQGPNVCPNVPVSFGARYNGSCGALQAEGITNIQWTVSPTPNTITNNSGMAGCDKLDNSGVLIRFPSQRQYNVTITAQNSCGVSNPSNAYVVTVNQSFCGGASPLAVSPNPSQGQINVTLQAGTPEVAADGLDVSASDGKTIPLNPASTIREIKVYNTQGVLIKTQYYGTGTTKNVMIDLGNQLRGVCILVITTDTGVFTKKVLITNR